MAAAAEEAGFAAFEPARWMDWFGRVACDRPGWMRRLARLETRLFEERLAAISIDRPIWIAGLARSGSTVLLELLAQHPAVATARYRDFPPVLTPILWNGLLQRMKLAPERAAERAHADGILVTSESPEAFEEPVWMAFFEGLHDRANAIAFDGATRDPTFEDFLRSHIRKLLLVRGARRYLAKANYNLGRLRYLRRLFPDARFLLPIRDPVWHVASLTKQHRRFSAAERRHPGATRHLARAGHFEFGLGRRPVAGLDAGTAAEIERLWSNSREAEGWALQWAAAYGNLARDLDADPALARAACVLRYEDLVREPGATMERVIRHCGLEAQPSIAAAAADRLHFPNYYRPAFAPAELAAIRERTAAVAARFGYGAADDAIAASAAGS